MPVLELTDRACKTPAVKGKQIDLIDSLVGGLVLRISGGRGVRAWRFHYKFGGLRKMMPLGRFPEVSLAKARDLAKDCRQKLAAGVDPAAPEPVDRSMTVGQLVESFLSRHAAAKRSSAEMRRRLEKNITPFIGTIKVSALHRRDVAACVDRIKDRGARTESNRVLEDIQSCLNWAVDRGDMEANPAAGMRKEEKKPRERSLSAEEIKLMWERLPSAPMTEDSRNAIRLALVCGQRIGEVTGMTRAELDLDAAIWRLPGARTKNGRPHEVPLSAMALSIIREQLRDGCEYIFRNKQGEQLAAAGVPHALQRGPQGEKTTLGLAHFTTHDLRRTFVTHLVELGVAPPVVEALINHISGSRNSVMGKHYNRHSYAREKAEAMALWNDRLSAIVAGDAAKIVPLRFASDSRG